MSARRRLILCMSVSLDGFVARTDGVIDWLSDASAAGIDHGDRRHRATLELLGQIGTIVIGRGAYQDMVRGWPGSDNPMAVLMNNLPKVVFSHSLSDVTWSNARLSRSPLEQEVPALKREPGKDLIVFGGARIAHSLIRHRLIDEYRLTMHPVALGEGLSLMHGLPEPQRLELIGSTAYADGCVTQVLQPAGAGVREPQRAPRITPM
jgi:dihydrofolate reductase